MYILVKMMQKYGWKYSNFWYASWTHQLKPVIDVDNSKMLLEWPHLIYNDLTFEISDLCILKRNKPGRYMQAPLREAKELKLF